MSPLKALAILNFLGFAASQMALAQNYAASPTMTYPASQTASFVPGNDFAYNYKPNISYVPYLTQQPNYSQMPVPVLANNPIYTQYSQIADSQLPFQAPQPRFLRDSPNLIGPDSYPRAPRARHVAKKAKNQTEAHAGTLKTARMVLKTSNGPLAKPRKLEVSKAISTSSLSPRKTPDIDPKQKQLLLELKSFIKETKNHKFTSFDDFCNDFRTHWKSNSQFYERNFLHIFENNFRPRKERSLNIRRIEAQIAKAVLNMNLNDYQPNSLASDSSRRSLTKNGTVVIGVMTPEELRDFLAFLVGEQNKATKAGRLPAGQYRVPQDLPDIFDLLTALLEASHSLLRDPQNRPAIIGHLQPKGINSYHEFKAKVAELLDYFRALLKHLNNLHSSANRSQMRSASDALKDMLRQLRDESLGPFFVRYMKEYRSLRIEGHNPTERQRQSLRYLTEQLVAEFGPDQFLDSVFRVLRLAHKLRGVNSDRNPQSVVPLEIFEQILENRIKNGSLKFLLVFYFDWLDQQLRNIQNFVFARFPGMKDAVKLDYKRFLSAAVNDLTGPSFRRLNRALADISRQIDTLLSSAPNENTRPSNFDEFVPIYARLLFKVLGPFYFLDRVPEFLEFIRENQLPKDHFPYNYKLALIRASLNNNSKPNQDWINLAQQPNQTSQHPFYDPTDNRIEEIINNLNHYLEILKQDQAGSDGQRAEILRLVHNILSNDVPEILTKTKLKVPSTPQNNHFFNYDHLEQPNPSYPPGGPSVNSKTSSNNIQYNIGTEPNFNIRNSHLNLQKRDNDLSSHLHADVVLDDWPTTHYKITAHMLDRASAVTKLLEQLFRYTTHEQNSQLIKFFDQLMTRRITSQAISHKLDYLYEAVDIYTKALEKLFDEKSLTIVREFWKTLLVFYTRRCHIKLYKKLSDQIAVANAQLSEQADFYGRMQAIIQNLISFLLANPQYDFRKECSSIIKLIIQHRNINQKIIKKTLFLHNFRKVLHTLSKGSNREGGEQPTIDKMNIINSMVRLSINPRGEFGKIHFEGQGASGDSIPPEEPPLDAKQLTFVRKVFTNFYKSFQSRNRLNDFSKILYLGIPKNKVAYFKALFHKYGNEPTSVFLKRHPNVSMQLQKMLLKTFSLPPKNAEQPQQRYVQFVKSLLQRANFTFGAGPDGLHIKNMSKLLYKPTPTQLRAFHLYYSQYRNADAFFKDRQSKNMINQLKAILYKPLKPETTERPPINPPEQRKSPASKAELRFIRNALGQYYKDTRFADSHGGPKRVSARVFLKRLNGQAKRSFFKLFQSYSTVGKIKEAQPEFDKLKAIIQKTLFKPMLKKKPCCSMHCFKIEDGVRTELTDEERKQLIGDYKCEPENQGFKMLTEDHSNQPGYGCACGCSGKRAAVQLNEKPVFNLTFDFGNEKDIAAFKDFIIRSQTIKALKQSNEIDLEKLKAKYDVASSQMALDFAFRLSNPGVAGSRKSQAQGQGNILPDDDLEGGSTDSKEYLRKIAERRKEYLNQFIQNSEDQRQANAGLNKGAVSDFETPNGLNSVQSDQDFLREAAKRQNTFGRVNSSPGRLSDGQSSTGLQRQPFDFNRNGASQFQMLNSMFIMGLDGDRVVANQRNITPDQQRIIDDRIREQNRNARYYRLLKDRNLETSQPPQQTSNALPEQTIENVQTSFESDKALI